MTRPTPTLIDDVIKMALGHKGPARSKQLNENLIDPVAFAKRCRRWVSNRNVVMLDVGPKVVNGNVSELNSLRVWVRTKVDRRQLSRPVPRVLRDAAFPEVPTDVVEIETSPPSDTARFPINPGRSCSRIDDAVGTGTMTCVAAGREGAFALTAAHVFALTDNRRTGIQVHGAGLADTPGTSSVGKVSQDMILLELEEINSLDVAAFQINASAVSRFDPSPVGLGPIGGVRDASTLTRGERVHMFGAASQRTMIGRVWSGNVARPVHFEDGTHWYKLANFIDIRFMPSERPIPGDSGSLIADMRGGAIGLYVGGGATSNRRFAVPLGPALRALDLTPIWQ